MEEPIHPNIDNNSNGRLCRKALDAVVADLDHPELEVKEFVTNRTNDTTDLGCSFRIDEQTIEISITYSLPDIESEFNKQRI